jgi:flagellar motor switch protein FliM
VEQLLALKVGDFIELDLNKMIEVKVDSVPVMEAQYGTSNGKYALKVDRMLTNQNMGWIGESNVG